MPAPTFVEASLALRRFSDPVAGRAKFDQLFDDLAIAVAPFHVEHARAARRAYERYGKGSGHSAQLNFGDCLIYGFAAVEGEPLLFKGDDFSKTDIVSALPA